MIKKVHFISGLPRSGSTLLAALLQQNPTFQTSIASPVAALCDTMLKTISGNPATAVRFDNVRRLKMLRGIFESYYDEVPSNDLVFDSNRIWTGRAALTGQLYPGSRIICCVRDISWIIDSIERLLAQNPQNLSRLFNFQSAASIYARADILLNSEKGFVGQAWNMLREAWFGDEAKRLIVIPYQHLVDQPQQTLSALYRELGEPEFLHDFNHVACDTPDDGALIGLPGLHKVRQKVADIPREPCIPPELFAKHVPGSFWLDPKQNTRGVCVIGAKPPVKSIRRAH